MRRGPLAIRLATTYLLAAWLPQATAKMPVDGAKLAGAGSASPCVRFSEPTSRLAHPSCRRVTAPRFVGAEAAVIPLWKRRHCHDASAPPATQLYPPSTPKTQHSNAGERCRLLVIDKWLISLNGKTTNTFSYDPVGSTEGQRRLANGLCSFAGTDSTLNTDEKAAMPDAWVVPSLATAIGVGFNLPNLGNELRISREQLANIFLGRIRKWSELANENPSLANVQQSIIVVVRADASAVSAELTKALSAFSTEWKDKVGSSSKPRWPRFDLADQGDTGVALKIRTTPYSLGYVGLASAETFQVSTALIANDAGVYVAPSLDGVEAAMEAFAATVAEMVKPGEKVFALSIVDPKNSPAAYPISMFTYFAFDAARLDCGQLHAVLYLIYWGWTDPQAAEIARKHHFAPTGSAVRDHFLQVLGSLGCKSTPSLLAGSGESTTTAKSVINQFINEANSDLRGAGTSSL